MFEEKAILLRGDQSGGSTCDDYYLALKRILGKSPEQPEYNEIKKLDEMLTEAGIPHTMERVFDGLQIRYPNNTKSPDDLILSAIEHFGSYGHNDDLIEIMGLLTQEELEYDCVLGWQTAQQVFDRIKQHWEVTHG